MYKKILAPLDGFPLAEAVPPHAWPLASSEEAQIMLLRVSADPAAEFSFSDPPLASPLIEELEVEFLSYLHSMRAHLQRAGLRTSFLIRQGAIAETIPGVAAEIEADVIAMFTQGRSGGQPRLLGNIASRVVNQPPIPALLIRPQFV